MNARRFGSMAPWAVGLTLAFGLHGAAAAFLLTHWQVDTDDVAGAPAILVDFASTPTAPAATRIALPSGPPQPQQMAQPEPKQEPKVEPKQTVAKIEAEAPPEKPIAERTDNPPQPLSQTTLDVALEPAAPVTIDVLPPRKPVEARQAHKPRHRQASLASAPPAAARQAARAAARAPGAATHDSDALPNWRSALVARIERQKRYPEAALARGEHGVAQVAFSVDRSGRLHDARIVRSSGSALLDRDALAWLQRSEPLPPPPPEVRGTRISVVVPLRYEIR